MNLWLAILQHIWEKEEFAEVIMVGNIIFHDTAREKAAFCPH